ncbi:chitin-binding protein [Pseudoalteromonas ulvae UL12]|uniref:lytic polysaccharide monooxygenase n=1 Tax=Pseudoalteromonas ulvae TaxID=107327 RepID=UPI00186B8235|nr:lytic polysaccharide monooxygenase [Pseudoalteromonas ulvae]MBE0362553.1 chitin-binding protein [Pseudoalteromonas ulvae UL12]
MKPIFKVTLITSALGLVATLASPSVTAHGYMDSPKARQAFCEAQGGYWWPQDGSNIPNLACRAAFLESGHVQFIQEHEFSVNTADFLNQAAVEANIPDGTLCSAGSHQKRGMNLPSADWQKTVVTPNANGEINVRFRATTPHNPSFWQFYLSKPSFNAATDTLKWQDLELVQSYGNVDFVKDPDDKRYYEMKVAIPADRQGEALLYTRWQRDDVVGEGFYNCSDIIIQQDTVTPVDWFALGYFVRQGQQANVGDTVWLRLFDTTGQELVSEQLAVTTQNQASWQAQLADSLNLNYSQYLQVGVQGADGNIAFDASNVASNQVFAVNKDYSFALSVQVAPDNTPPIVNDIADVSLDEATSINVHVHAFDDENDPITFTYDVPAPLTYSAEGMNLTLAAGEVDTNTTVIIGVTVSDGQLSTTKRFNVTVNDTPVVDPTDPAWQENKAYSAGDIVTYNGQKYRAKWWVKGEKPDTSSAWELLSPTSNDQWQAVKSYPGGSEVSHLGAKYQAKWWTQGEEPGKASVWQAL